MSPNLPNPYHVLGVAESASAAEIKRAYRKLARENHPDSNPGNDSKEARFKDISAAYEILGDDERRARYDALKTAGPGAIPQGVFDLGDLFAQMFGGAAAAPAGRPRQAPYEPAVSFNFPDLGSVFGDIGSAPPSSPSRKRPAPASTRRLADGTVATINGLDLIAELRIGFDEAILGAKVTVATKDGKAVIGVPKGTSSGTKLRLRGKGLRAAAGRTGDLYYVVQIDVPSDVDDDAARLLVQFRDRAKNGKR